MHMTKTKPTKPGWYWFIRAGSHPARAIPARVVRRGRGLSYTTGGCGDSGWDTTWGDFDAVSTTSPEHLMVEYQHADEEHAELALVAERLKAALNDHAVWSVGYTEGDGKTPTFVVYRAPAFLPLEVPPTFEGFNVVLQTASKPVMF